MPLAESFRSSSRGGGFLVSKSENWFAKWYCYQGRFKYQPGQVRAFGMIAGGSGITPMFQVCIEINFCCIFGNFMVSYYCFSEGFVVNNICCFVLAHASGC